MYRGKASSASAFGLAFQRKFAADMTAEPDEAWAKHMLMFDEKEYWEMGIHQEWHYQTGDGGSHHRIGESIGVVHALHVEAW